MKHPSQLPLRRKTRHFPIASDPCDRVVFPGEIFRKPEDPEFIWTGNGINYTVSRARNYRVIPRVLCPSSRAIVFPISSGEGERGEGDETRGFICEIRPRI